jgi:hypothetical protein
MRFLPTFGRLNLPAPLIFLPFALAIACLAWCAPQPAWASQATATTLSLTSGGHAVSSVAGGTVVTLTAPVQAGATTLELGHVNFCDATAPSCTDIHQVGTGQLTSAGTAVLRLIATLMGAAIGCGGGKAAAPPSNPGTTPGAYTVTVTGSSGAITATTAVTVTVS